MNTFQLTIATPDGNRFAGCISIEYNAANRTIKKGNVNDHQKIL